MLGIQQQTHTAPAHHTTTCSAVSAAASPPTSLRAIPTTRTRRSTVQKQSFSDTLSPTQDIQETRAEARTEPSSAWSEAAGNDHDTDEHKAESESDKPGEVANTNDDSAEGPPASNAAQAEDSTTEQVQEKEGADGKTDPVGDYTRHPSSPLSELSPAPEEDESPNQERDEGEQSSESAAAATAGQNGSLPTLGHLNPSSVGHSTVGISQNSTVPTAAFGGDSNVAGGLSPSTLLRNSSSQLQPASEASATFSPGKQLTGDTQASPSGLTSGSPKAAKESKFSILLDLNAELFRVCQAFVSAGYSPQATPEAQPFAKRLEENLHWMSAHADGRPFAITGPPETEPPALSQSVAQIPFPEGVFERINNLYSRLRVIFANDIARKSQLFPSPSAAGTPARNSATPSILPSSGIGMKRERPDSAGFRRHESPTAAKRRDTGENKTFMGPSAPMHGSSGSTADMPPPTTPGFPSPSHSQLARPGSSAGGINPMAVSDSQVQGSMDGMFSPGSSATMGMNNMHGLGNMGNLSPEAQARTRQMQLRQAMMTQQQQHQQQQAQMHQPGVQEQQGLQHGSPTGQTAMSSPHRQSSVSLSPTQQQQMLQAQAVRQMSPPGSTTGGGSGIGSSMGINGTDGMGSGQQSPVASNMPQANMSMNSGGTSVNANMTLNPQLLANMSSGAIAAYQVLQNPQHPMTRYLNQQMPGFSQLPIMDQMRRFQALQQQRQMQQQSQRNQQMMANQMMGSQTSPTNATASGSGSSQLGQMGQMNVGPQMQSSTSETGFPGTPVSANVPGRPGTSMGMPQQMGGMSGMQGVPNMANLNPHQRQLYLMQMQMRNAGIGGSNLGANTGMNPAMANPQLLQERQRLEQQQRLALAQRGSPLNPTASAGQFPPGLRSNPTASVGIARTGRSPSVTGDMAGAGTPRIGGRMLPGADDYQRQALLQQAQRNAHMQQQQQQGFMQGQGQPQAGWQGQQSQQMPLSAGAWPHQNQGFGMGSSPPNSGLQGVDFMSPSRQASATPAPSMGHHSPTGPTTDFDNMMNW